ncbi:MAG TPA: serine hydrolase, partial [Thermomicrobiales bacterium]|nr:serine hydrolase [Thermomicrobiales bacterium]
MTTNHRETHGRRVANGRISRRRVLMAGGTGLAATAVLAAGLTPSPVAAQDATPAPARSGGAQLPLTGERLAAFEAYVAAKLAETAVPGAAVAVVQGGETVLFQGFGVRELGQPAPITGDTLLRIGS